MRKVKLFTWLLLAAMILMTACSKKSDPAPSTGGGSTGTQANTSPIKVGLLVPLTGNFAAPGKYMQEGVELMLKQSGNKLAGREVQLVIEDSQGNPQTALTKIRKLVEQDKVEAVLGPLTAAEGSALVQYIDSQQIPTVFPIASSDDLTQRTIPKYVVRTGWTSSQTTQPFGEYAAKTMGIKKVVSIAFDYSFGWESIGGFVRTFQENGGKVVKQLWPPLSETNYLPYLSQIPADVDAVLCSFSGATAIAFSKQYKDFGLTKPLLCQGNTTDESTLQQTGDPGIGIMGPIHYTATIDSPNNKKFVADYTAAYGHEPSYYSEGAYVGAQVLKKGLEATKGETKDRAALVKALRAVQLTDAPRGPFKFDEYGNPVQNVYLRKVEKKGDKFQNTIIFTWENVSQFWKYAPQDFLKNPVYSRSYPPITGG